MGIKKAPACFLAMEKRAIEDGLFVDYEAITATVNYSAVTCTISEKQGKRRIVRMAADKELPVVQQCAGYMALCDYYGKDMEEAEQGCGSKTQGESLSPAQTEQKAQSSHGTSGSTARGGAAASSQTTTADRNRQTEKAAGTAGNSSSNAGKTQQQNPRDSGREADDFQVFVGKYKNRKDNWISDMVKTADGRKTLSMLCDVTNPGYALPEKIVELTGITDDFLAGMPKEAEVIHEIAGFFKGMPVMGYNNIQFDDQFMDAMYTRNGLTFAPQESIDIYKVVKAVILLDETVNYKLGVITKYLGFDDRNSQFHNAEGDTMATLLVAGSCIDRCREKCRKSAQRLIRTKVVRIARWENLRNQRQKRIYVETEDTTVYFDCHTAYVKEHRGKSLMDGNLDKVEEEIRECVLGQYPAEKKQKLMAEKKNLEDFQKKVELTGDVERFRFDLKPGQYPDSRAMPSVVTFQIEFDDELDEAPGIRKWLDTFEDGYRNCCIKAILRFYLADPCIFLFRRDGWQPGLLREPEKQVRMTGKPARGKKGQAQKKKKAAVFPSAGDYGNGVGPSGSDPERYEGTAKTVQEERRGYTVPMETRNVQERRNRKKRKNLTHLKLYLN